MTVQELIDYLEKVPNKKMKIFSTDLDIMGERRILYPFTKLSIEVNHRDGSHVLLENFLKSTYEIIDKFHLQSPVEEYIVLYQKFED